MKMKYKLEHMYAEHVPRAYDIDRAAFGSYCWLLRAINEVRRQPSIEPYVVNDPDGAMVAFMFLQRQGSCGKLLRIAVHPEDQWQGIGRAALNLLQQRLEHRLTMDVPEHNLPAQLWAKACGLRCTQIAEALDWGESEPWTVYRFHAPRAAPQPALSKEHTA